MAIVIRNTGSAFAPCLVCDACGVEIKQEEGAGVTYEMETEAGVRGPVRWLCKKNHCLSRETGRYKLEGWTEVDHFLCYLLNNIGMTEREMKRSRSEAEFLSRF